MGRDKALLPFRGGTLVEQICRAVASAAGNVTLVGRPDLGGVPDLCIPDLYPGEGPLGGILTALRHTHSEWNLIVACDLPNLDAEFLTGLLQFAPACSADVLLPCDPAARPQPLCAVYHRRALVGLEASFLTGVRSVKTALTTLAIERVAIAEIELFQNVNTPEDWAAYDAK
jgi:molybdopterin-guanine dinucleotide biosynthesis protein A